MTTADRVTYVGHATVLLELEGARLITDPVLRSWVGPLRRQGAPPAPGVADDIDAVLISHLHSDHADLPSLRRFRRDVPMLVPPGARTFFERQGFVAVSELAAGESRQVKGIAVAATEATHPVKRRSVSKTEAIGFLAGGARRVYFAGDTDLFDGMEALGGGLDLALLPIWGWGPNLGAGHLNPKRAARAAVVRAPRLALPLPRGALDPAGLWPHRPPGRHPPPREFAAQMREHAPQVEVRVLAPGEATSLS